MVTLDDINKEIRAMGYSSVVPRTEKPNFYRLEDGTILRIYPILNNVIIDPKNLSGASVNANNVVGIFVPKKLHGLPSDKASYSQQELQANIENIDVGVDILSENFNVYEVDDKWVLSIKTTLSQVTRTKLYDSRGEPIYIISTAVIPKIRPK